MSTVVDLSKYKNSLSFRNKLGRLLWGLVYHTFYKICLSNKIRIFILKMFGAKIGRGSVVHVSAKIWAPWNLEIGEYTCIGPQVDCYNVGKVMLGNNVTISQYSYLCAASHDISKSDMPLVIGDIIVCDQAWVAADSFVGMNIQIGEGAVLGARSSAFSNLKPWSVYGGIPARLIKERIIYE